MQQIAVLIPCYNEALTVEKVVRDFRAALPEAEIYVYDNNSTDETGLLAEKSGATVVLERRQGKGNVIRSMFRDIDADCYVMVDGDDTYPAENAPEMARLVLEEHADMVIGDRLSSTYFSENKRIFHNSGNRVVRGFINLLFHSDVRDVMTGYRAFSRRFVKSYPVLAKGFEIETEMTIHAIDKKFELRTVAVNYCDRPKGSFSKLSTVSDGTKVLKTIAGLFKNYKPMAFFGVIAALLSVISLILVAPVFAEYFRTGLVPRFPTLIFGGFVGMSGLISFFTGAILDSIAHSNRQEFELYLNMMDSDKR